MKTPKVVSIEQALASVTFLPNRVPSLTGTGNAFTQLADYRNGGIWVGHYAGISEWERHPNGDEFIQIIDGNTTLILLTDKKEVRYPLAAGEIMVVPQNSWHRFETPTGVKIMTITPQPSDHQIEQPE